MLAKIKEMKGPDREMAERIDDGNMWPTDYALRKLTSAEEKKIAALVRQAVS